MRLRTPSWTPSHVSLHSTWTREQRPDRWTDSYALRGYWIVLMHVVLHNHLYSQMRNRCWLSYSLSRLSAIFLPSHDGMSINLTVFHASRVLLTQTSFSFGEAPLVGWQLRSSISHKFSLWGPRSAFPLKRSNFQPCLKHLIPALPKSSISNTFPCFSGKDECGHCW